MVIGDQVAVFVDDHGRGERRIHPETGTIRAVITLLDEPLGVDIGDRWRAQADGVGVAGRLIGFLGDARHQVGTDKHHEEGDRQSDDDRLQDKDKS